jgi:hypothetical protein
MAKKHEVRAQLNFRPAPDLRKRLDVSAKQQGITINSEVIRRLEESFDRQPIDKAIAAQANTTKVTLESSMVDHLKPLEARIGRLETSINDRIGLIERVLLDHFGITKKEK